MAAPWATNSLTARLRSGILPRVDPPRFSKAFRDIIHDPVVPILSPQMHISFDSYGLKTSLGQPDQRDVESPAAQVIDQDGLLPIRKGVFRRDFFDPWS